MIKKTHKETNPRKQQSSPLLHRWHPRLQEPPVSGVGKGEKLGHHVLVTHGGTQLPWHLPRLPAPAAGSAWGEEGISHEHGALAARRCCPFLTLSAGLRGKQMNQPQSDGAPCVL